MERFDLSELQQEAELYILTESGSTYVVSVDETPRYVGGNMFGGLRVSRQSEHKISGVNTSAQDAHNLTGAAACIELHSPERGVISTGHRIEVRPDYVQEDKSVPGFNPFVTSKVVNIEYVKASEQE